MHNGGDGDTEAAATARGRYYKSAELNEISQPIFKKAEAKELAKDTANGEAYAWSVQDNIPDAFLACLFARLSTRGVKLRPISRRKSIPKCIISCGA